MRQDFNETIGIIREMAARFQKIEGRPWGAEGTLMELAKQVGDLSARIMTKEGYYFKNRDKIHDNKYSPDTDAIADEIFDILFATIRLADHYKIDIPATTRKTQKINKEWFKSKGLKF